VTATPPFLFADIIYIFISRHLIPLYVLFCATVKHVLLLRGKTRWAGKYFALWRGPRKWEVKELREWYVWYFTVAKSRYTGHGLERKKEKMRTGFWWISLFEHGRFEDRYEGAKINYEPDLRKYIVWMWTGLKWLRFSDKFMLNNVVICSIMKRSHCSPYINCFNWRLDGIKIRTDLYALTSLVELIQH
jgi:hypothetical protein